MDIKLDENNNPVIEKNDVVIIYDREQIRQQLRLNLRTIRGEWFIDLEKGVPYFEVIFRKGTKLADISTVLIDEILKTPGVRTINKFNMDFDNKNRSLEVNFDYYDGELITNFSEVL